MLKKITKKRLREIKSQEPNFSKNLIELLGAFLIQRIKKLNEVAGELAGCYLFSEVAPPAIFKELTPEKTNKSLLLEANAETAKEINEVIRETDELFKGSEPKIEKLDSIDVADSKELLMQPWT